jgi:hypothetical protein
MSDDDKTRTTRLRRIAERQGFRLVKSRRRDPRALTYGRWHVVDRFTGKPVAGHDRAGSSWTLDEVEAWLTTRPME